jgi:putative transposase
VKLTVSVKLTPSSEQADSLKETLRTANAAANYISGAAWEHRSFGKYKLQELYYYEARERFTLSAQMVIRVLSKVADAYRLDKRCERTFRLLGAIAYDDRILSWREADVSIWTVSGRERIPFVCDKRTREMLSSRRGESDLLYREGKWYLLATVDVEEPPPGTPEDWLGVDLGIKNIAADSEGEIYSGGQLRGLRHRYARIRARLQSRQSEAAKKLLKKRKRRERRMATHCNHVISKRIVRKAQDTNCGISLEDLKGIRGRITARKSQRRRMHSWSFGQLRSFIEYKARLAGVPVVFVDPRNTSRTCPECGCVDKRNRSERDTFCCVSCSFAGEADTVAAENIRRVAVNLPDLGCRVSAQHTQKPPPSGGGCLQQQLPIRERGLQIHQEPGPVGPVGDPVVHR